MIARRQQVSSVLTRRRLVHAAGMAAISGAALATYSASAMDLIPTDPDPMFLDPPRWHEVVGGAGTILFYNYRKGQAATATLDGSGPSLQQAYYDFPRNIALMISTPDGSVLMIRHKQKFERESLAISGVLSNGTWTEVRRYRDFAPWTHGTAVGSSIFLYDRNRQSAATGTLIEGEWTFVEHHRKWPFNRFNLLGATADSLLLFANDSKSAARAGTIINGRWTYTGSYPDITELPGRPNFVLGGNSDTLLFLKVFRPDSGQGVSGRFVGGIWQRDHEYTDFASWDHVTSAGNGFVLLWDLSAGDYAWGTLTNGLWTYYGQGYWV